MYDYKLESNLRTSQKYQNISKHLKNLKGFLSFMLWIRFKGSFKYFASSIFCWFMHQSRIDNMEILRKGNSLRRISLLPSLFPTNIIFPS